MYSPTIRGKYIKNDFIQKIYLLIKYVKINMKFCYDKMFLIKIKRNF